MPIGCYRCYRFYPIDQYQYTGKCNLVNCCINVKHKHILCNTCKESLDSNKNYSTRNCFDCKVDKVNKGTTIHLHHFHKSCGFKNCIKIGSHEHYLCKSCNNKRNNKFK